MKEDQRGESEDEYRMVVKLRLKLERKLEEGCEKSLYPCDGLDGTGSECDDLRATLRG